MLSLKGGIYIIKGGTEMAKENPKVTYTTSIDRELRDRFKAYCALKRKYQNEVLEELIEDLLSREGEGEGDEHNTK
jgi:hypothetical protein